jgi:hypothetical protein
MVAAVMVAVTRPSASREVEALLDVDRDLRRLVSDLRDLVGQERAESKRRKEVIQPGEIVSEDRAARALPIRRADAVGWLRREGLSVQLEGRQVVVWDRVLERLGGAPAPAPAEVPPRRRKKRKTADPPLLAKPGRMFG